MDDDKIDVAIRTVLPSRYAANAPSGRDPILGLEPMLPPVDRSRKPRKKKSQALPPLEIERINKKRKQNLKKPKNARRSLAARAAWKARKKAAAPKTDVNAVAVAVAALAKLEPAQRELAMQIVRLFP